MADVGQALLDANVVTQVQLDQNRRGSGDLISNLLKQGLLKDDEYVRAVTKAFGLQEVNFTSVKPDPQAVKAVPATTLRACQALPFRLEANKLHMAILDPGSEKHLARIKRAVPNLTLELYVVGPQALEKALTANLGVDRRAKSPLDLLPPMKELEAKLKNAVQEVQPEQAEDPNESLDKLEIKELDPPVLRIIKGLLIKALRMGASDLHVETMEHELRVRFRVDGCLKEVLRLPAEMKAAIASCLKIMSNMDIAERRIPQDG
ncbi:MAG TPA: ATPase, T2SS/T4P/T4SS family, partial [Planctomycetota bacterium]|nr:ATPase, T2SS/T4P/T4SS family [Planctomycetota bacterium]